MMKDKTLEELFLAQKPHFSDNADFMSALTKRLDAVEFIKQHQEATIRRYKMIMVAAFVVGIISGAVAIAFHAFGGHGHGTVGRTRESPFGDLLVVLVAQATGLLNRDTTLHQLGHNLRPGRSCTGLTPDQFQHLAVAYGLGQCRQGQQGQQQQQKQE